MRRLLLGLALLAVLAVAGCGRGRPVERVAAEVRSQASAPARVAPACTAKGTTALVKRFFAALRARQVGDLDGFFAPAGRFGWYANSVRPGVRLGAAALDRATLLDYLRRRQARHERIEVVLVDFNGYRASDRTAHFGMTLRRTADDLPAGPQPLAGKGAVDCDSQRLMVMGIGQR
jgi:hypothetical protein